MASQRDRCAGVLRGLGLADRNGGPAEMASVLAESLVALGRYDAADVGQRYLGWWGAAGPAVWDCGPIAEAVFRLAAGDPVALPTAAAEVDHTVGGMTAGANACHRVPPLAMIYCLSSEDVLVSAAAADAAMTHASPLASASSVAVVLVCRHLILGSTLAIACTRAAEHPSLAVSEVAPIRQALLAAPAPVETLDAGGFCVEVLAAALHFAFVAKDFAGGLDLALDFAGLDNYCPVICGAFLGARFGSAALAPNLFDHSRSHGNAQFGQLQSALAYLAHALAGAWPMEDKVRKEREVQKEESNRETEKKHERGENVHIRGAGSPTFAPRAASRASPVSLVDVLPDLVICFVLSFLHSFLIAGWPSSACRVFAMACGNEALCEHTLSRDLAPEEHLALPDQPRRPGATLTWQPLQQPLQLIDISEGVCGRAEAARQLRLVASDVCHRVPVAIAHTAARDGRPALLAWAAQRVALHDIDGCGRSALMVAAMNNRPLTVGVAAAHCNLEQQYQTFGSALHMAAYVGAAAAVAELCRCGADLEAVNKTFKQTPLLVACSRDHAEVVQALIAGGALTSAIDRDGLTALRLAQFMRSAAAEQVLLQDLGEGNP